MSKDQKKSRAEILFENALLYERCTNLIAAGQPFAELADELDKIQNKELIERFLRVDANACRNMRHAIHEALKLDYEKGEK